jgi:hypothetical protein
MHVTEVIRWAGLQAPQINPLNIKHQHGVKENISFGLITYHAMNTNKQTPWF